MSEKKEKKEKKEMKEKEKVKEKEAEAEAKGISYYDEVELNKKYCTYGKYISKLINKICCNIITHNYTPSPSPSTIY